MAFIYLYRVHLTIMHAYIYIHIMADAYRVLLFISGTANILVCCVCPKSKIEEILTYMAFDSYG